MWVEQFVSNQTDHSTLWYQHLIEHLNQTDLLWTGSILSSSRSIILMVLLCLQGLDGSEAVICVWFCRGLYGSRTPKQQNSSHTVVCWWMLAGGRHHHRLPGVELVRWAHGLRSIPGRSLHHLEHSHRVALICSTLYATVLAHIYSHCLYPIQKMLINLSLVES